MKIRNATPFVVQELLLADQDGRDVVTVLVKATFSFDRASSLVAADEQVTVNLAGTYYGEPGKSSARFEPEVAPFKLATDVVLVGHAHADRPGARYVDVSLHCGPIQKVARVFGDRVWYKRAGFESVSDAQPFERVPLVYERAFGGWDRTSEAPGDHTVERRNPVGVGYHDKKHGRFIEGAPLPNVEDPRDLISSYTDAPRPIGFGFVEPGWATRAVYGGTYDRGWVQHRMPLLPRDFDPRFYNAAPPDQQVAGLLRGDEAVYVNNASPGGKLAFYLPAEPPPACVIETQTGPPQSQVSRLDTVIVDTDTQRVLLIWRACFAIHRQVHQLAAIGVALNRAVAAAPTRMTAVLA